MIKITQTNVTIMAQDMNKAIAFYESIGLTLQQRWGDHYAMISTTGITIGLHPGGKGGAGCDNVSIGFMIDSADEAKALLEKNSIAFKFSDDKSGVYLHFHDLDGTLLYFTQPKWR